MDHGELIRAAQQGDREAFDELVRQTYVDTFTLAYRLTGNEEDARDVAQDAYLRAWRGIGVIPKSGWKLSEAYQDFDAEERFHITGIHTEESPLCRSGDVLRGAIKPAQCAAFGKECTPRHPLGATMVSSEGACAAYFNYGRFLSAEDLATAGAGLTGNVPSSLAHG